MTPIKVVITGGPGTGKTSIINSLKEKGYSCFEEIVRKLTLEAKNQEIKGDLVTNPLAFVPDPEKFNQQILNARILQYEQGTFKKTEHVFYDRGIPDIIAYMDYFGQAYNNKFLKPCEQLRYDHVILLPPWKEIYRSDNERLETFEEAVAIHDQLEKTYLNLGYGPLIVPKGTVPERTNFILSALNLSN